MPQNSIPATAMVTPNEAPPTVTAYYSGNGKSLNNYKIEALTHIIFGFGHLQGSKLDVDTREDSVALLELSILKKKYPNLKILLSLGGWGGCETCSEVFSSEKNRLQFALSVKDACKYFEADGIDLDWEYPVIEGYPNHPFKADDKKNFTALVQVLRKTLGNQYEISLAVGGFTKFLKESIEWNKLAPLVDRMNLMSYDLVNGMSTTTGHLTPLYSTPQQVESVDNAIRFFDSIKFPLKKIVIGAAFYGREFNIEKDSLNNNDGLYQKGSFAKGISWKELNMDSMQRAGYQYHWDDVAKASYLYNPTSKRFFTYDSEESIKFKTKYVLSKQLNGIMFWQLDNDRPSSDGLLEVIHKTLQE